MKTVNHTKGVGMEIIEIKSFADAKTHGNRFDSIPAFLQRRFGNDYKTIFVDTYCATVSDRRGNRWDVYHNCPGDFVVYPAE